MKKISLQIYSIVCLVILIGAISASAQTQYRTHIPFDFNIGQKSYKSGDYSVGLLSQVGDQKMIVIRDANGRNSYALMPRNAEANTKIDVTKIIFNRYANQYFLTEISAPSFHAELAKSKIEERIAKTQQAERELVLLGKEN